MKRIAFTLIAFSLSSTVYSRLFRFASLLGENIGARESLVPQYKTLTVPEVESRLREQNAFGMVRDARTKLQCEKATAPWNFSCTFEPTPLTSTTRVKFGIRADNNGTILETSQLTPADAALPAPTK